VEPQQRDRVRDDLKGFFKGELLFDDVARGLYSSDASIFQVQPAGVVIPRDEEDAAALVKYCHENQAPLTPRGAGTGVAGESLGRGLIVDLSRSFREIVEVGPDWVRVQPGVTLRALNERLAQGGRRFAPDPASGAVCTIGGMLATNASGSRAIKHGYTRSHVRELRVILDNGEIAVAGRHPWPVPGDDAANHFTDTLSVLGVLLEEGRRRIAANKPKLTFNRLGYSLHDVLVGAEIDLPKLLVGSEGTLALFTEATLTTIPLPGATSVALLAFTSLEKALQALPKVLSGEPSACELLDRRLLSVARGSDAAEVARLVAPGAEQVLLVEFETDSAEEAKRRAENVIHVLTRVDRLALYGQAGLTQADQDRLWRLRDVILPSLYRLRGGPPPVLGIEDVAVPVDALGDYLRRVQDIFRQHETTASFLVHAGAGQVQARPFLDLRKPADVSKLAVLSSQVHELALSLGGTVSSRHGTGLARTSWVARQAGPLYPFFRQVKAIFDPRNIFNPGKIVDPDPQVGSWPLRKFSDETPPKLELRWQPLEVIDEANHCNGCGSCRTEAPSQRMCPIFRATNLEAASPRAKANLLRLVLRDGADSKAFSSDDARDIADLCVNCKMCKSECPAHVNIPKLMLEAKAANVAEHGLPRGEWFFTHLEYLSRLGSSTPIFSNAILRSRAVRWLLGRLFGLAPKRRLPTFARTPFLQLAQRRGWTRLPPPSRLRVALFVDLYANYFDPQIAESAALVLWHQGFDVYVPPGQGSSGIEALSNGDVETAREQARRNLRVFADLAREGMPIVCTEPSAALMLRHDYLDLVDDLDARLVADRTVEFTAFLGELRRHGKFRTDFHTLELKIGHHVPCHLKALSPMAAAGDLLRMIPGVEVTTIDKSCSGMAGTFGLKRKNFEISRQAGNPMFDVMASPTIALGTTECSSCRMQMEDATGKRALHPAQYLALAYGLLPSMADRLKEPLRELVLR
jgi:FAD/FMN-containing dehydrogenase/Fe-S oxidoreductase